MDKKEEKQKNISMIIIPIYSFIFLNLSLFPKQNIFDLQN